MPKKKAAKVTPKKAKPPVVKQPKKARKYSAYDKLRMRLKRAEISPAGPNATFLFRLFMDQAGVMYADDVVKAGLCEEKKFTVWRKKLVDAGFIVYDPDYAKKTNMAKHLAGPHLVDLVNDEMRRTQLLMTEQRYETDMVAFNMRMVELGKFVKTLIEKIDPPYTEEKEEQYMADPGALADAWREKIETELLNSPMSSSHPDYGKELKN